MTEEIIKFESCAGCGVKLQTTYPNRLGYIPSKAQPQEPVICQRCFRIKHYNEIASVALNQQDFVNMLGHIAETRSLVVHIVDVFDFEGSLIASLQRFVGTNPVLLVVNKIDLLPKVTNLNKIVNWVQKQAKEQGLKIVDVVLCSALKSTGFDRVVEALTQHRGKRDVYVVGATNVGKSTLINRLIRDFSNLEAELTTSRYPGTTLDLVKIPIDDGKYIIDTPGIVYTSRLTELVTKRDLNSIMPERTIKPIVFQLDEQQSLFFGALVRFDFVKGAHQSFSCFVAAPIHIHRTKLERADELYASHKGEMLAPPAKAHLHELPEWTRHQLRIQPGTNKDVAISGLGWIKVNSTSGAIVDIHAPKGVKVIMRDSLI